MTLNQTQKNMVAACQEVLRWCDRNNVGQDKPGYTPRHRLQRIAIMTIMTESGGHMYANANIPTSLKIPHDAIGSDHHSVGMFQQQVGSDGTNAFGWGTVQQCMDINHSVDAFLRALKNKDLHSGAGRCCGCAASTCKSPRSPTAPTTSATTTRRNTSSTTGRSGRRSAASNSKPERGPS
jgi:hypothetical protein